MRIGIPRALLYYRYGTLWKSFFAGLGLETVVSPETNREIVQQGESYAVDEACFSSKVYLGHVEWLIGRCDYILVPRISHYGKKGNVCIKFQALYDVVWNTFRDREVSIINYNIDTIDSDKEFSGFLSMGRKLGKKRSSCLRAYLEARQEYKNVQMRERKEQEKLLGEPGMKILLVGQRYNLEDPFIGRPVVECLRELDTVPVFADITDRKKAAEHSGQLTETLPWIFSRELVGSVVLHKKQVDGIILLSSFPCGPDSLVNEMLLRRVKDRPIISLIMDGHEGRAGIETRLESFVDIIRFKKDGFNEQL